MRLSLLFKAASVYIFLITLAYVFPLKVSAQAYDRMNNFYDYMVRDVCITSNGELDTTHVPGQPSCVTKSQRRNMRVEDPIYYGNHDFYFPPSFVNLDPEITKFGVKAWNSIPVEYNGNTRIALIQDAAHPITGVGWGDYSDDSISLRWFDEDYGFIVYTENNGRAPRGSSSMWYSEYYCDQVAQGKISEDSPLRFWQGWIHASLKLPSVHDLDQVHYTTQKRRMERNLFPESGCPSLENVREALFFWVRSKFQYRNGQTFDSIVTQKFSDGESGSSYPEDAESFERIYFTDEFGVTRHEIWTRFDPTELKFVRQGITSIHEVEPKAQNVNNCKDSLPYDLPTEATPHLRTGAMKTNSFGQIYEVYRERRTDGERHIWYMEQCSDFTNVQFAPDPNEGYPKPDFNIYYSLFFKNE